MTQRLLAIVALTLLLSTTFLVTQVATATDEAPADVAAAAAVATAAAIAAVENPSAKAPEQPSSHHQSNALSKLAQCLRTYPCGLWAFLGIVLLVVVLTGTMLIYSGGESIPSLTTSFFFWLGLGYLVLLLLVGAFYAIQRTGTSPYMVGGLLPIGVPWFGALGAVTISLAGVFFYSTQDWNNRFNYWHIGRPLFGAVVAIVAFFLYILIVVSAGTKVPIFEPRPEPREFIVYYVLAFLVGYREETFRELIQRVTDLILKPSSAPAADAASIVFQLAGVAVTTANVGTATVAVPAKLIVDVKNAGKMALKHPAVHLENGSAPEISITNDQLAAITELAPGASKSVEITLTVPALGKTYSGALVVTGSNLKAARLELTGKS